MRLCDGSRCCPPNVRQPRGWSNPKPFLTWGLIRVFALHEIRYRTSLPPAGFAAADHPADGLRATVPAFRPRPSQAWGGLPGRR